MLIIESIKYFLRYLYSSFDGIYSSRDFQLIFLRSMQKKGVKTMSIDIVRVRLKEFLSELTQLMPQKLQRDLKLKYSLQALVPLSRPLIHCTIIFLIRTRFPLLLALSAEKDPLFSFDKNLKQIYQQQLKLSRLKTQFQFQYFLFISIKLCVLFIGKYYDAVLIGREQEQEMYCLAIKAILGLNVERQCYRVIESKFVDRQKYELATLQEQLQKNQKNRLATREMILHSKNSITMNAVQARMQKRRIKRCTKVDRSSITLLSANTTIQKFKEDLQKSLKITSPNNSRSKERYTALQKLNFRQMAPQSKMGKQLIHTQQISASMNLSLLLKNSTHSYTRRDLVLRHSNRPSRLTHRVYQLSGSKGKTAPTSKEQDRGQGKKVSQGKGGSQEKVNQKQSLVLPSLQDRKSHNTRSSVQLQNKKAYWTKIKRQLRQYNSTLEY